MGGSLDYDKIGTTTLWRFVFTIAACALYLFSMLIWCPKEADSIGSSLSKQARAVHSYCKAVVAEGDDQHESEESKQEPNREESTGFHLDSSQSLFNLREEAIKARVAAMDGISDACLTSIWKGDYHIDPFSLGPAVCFEMLILICVPLMLDMLRADQNKRQAHVSEHALARLLLLADRLQGIHVCKDEAGDEDDNTLFSKVIARANRRLDAADYNLMFDGRRVEVEH